MDEKLNERTKKLICEARKVINKGDYREGLSQLLSTYESDNELLSNGHKILLLNEIIAVYENLNSEVGLNTDELENKSRVEKLRTKLLLENL